ncbi:truncated membrane protein ORF30 [Cyprinid herpesvirus 3]|uniref:Truncated membrane protein ORF30 n=1 Tax=Cyprinid herpesvirus 3 TaxID=180230 RepID=H8PF55_CYHV3|nr:unnamed protein product [Cyprinid herpesvirus 3]AFD97200.1 truncated membrane protein ORF30 [Cyprinid herpesvirus 3]
MMNVGFLVLLATVATVKGQLELLPVLTMDWAVQWMDVVDIFNTTGHGVIDNISDPTIISWFVPFTTTTTLPSSNSTFLSTLSSTSTVAEAESTLAANSTEASTWAYTPTPAGTQGTSENFLETEAASTSLAPEKLSQTSPELTQTSEPFSQSESTQISLSTNETAAAPETTAAATQEPSSATSTPAASTSPSESSTVWMIESRDNHLGTFGGTYQVLRGAYQGVRGAYRGLGGVYRGTYTGLRGVYHGIRDNLPRHSRQRHQQHHH